MPKKVRISVTRPIHHEIRDGHGRLVETTMPKQVYAWFRITVCPSFYVIGCKEKAAQESRGLFGCHFFTSCPDCEVIPKGYEFWGENGHLQSSAPDRASMCWQVGHMAKKVWSMQGGGLMRYKFRVGSPIYIRGAR